MKKLMTVGVVATLATGCATTEQTTASNKARYEQLANVCNVSFDDNWQGQVAASELNRGWINIGQPEACVDLIAPNAAHKLVQTQTGVYKQYIITTAYNQTGNDVYPSKFMHVYTENGVVTAIQL
ncbi:hypothetical protein ACFSJY_11870 [Thalassotalea euphylliae]|uniref:hypothetical protein n=1 Tax=Thalassotalea euphylliae TaxID=1655234 RepID=UPI003637E365